MRLVCGVETERDYILGTHDDELRRLGLQHQVWRKVALDAWRRAGIGQGVRVLDIGAGPGYAALDLAKIVGPSGKVIAIERSSKFASALRDACRQQAIDNIAVYELDLMTDELPNEKWDFAWSRWVATFVNDVELLVKKLAASAGRGSKVIFQEYAHYQTWRFSPRLPKQERFREQVESSWRESGGEPDVGLELPPLLTKHGFEVTSATPHLFCVKPGDQLWKWPSSFIPIGLARLVELGQINKQFADEVQEEFDRAEADPTTLMITPLVLEIIAERK